ncbi:MAG: polyprenol monophosphomannose synthase [Candidatus Aenigmarchaeota archaeon]|nr:polyprenol monophosphomannose synthase [Candidatus Aenigmarchaeota archaeon]
MARVSVIVPTLNERENLLPLLQGIGKELPGAEVIVVDDDSPDRTWELAERARRQYPGLRVIRRRGKRGLSSAVLRGFDAGRGQVLVCMDADLSHDPRLLPDLVSWIRQGGDLAVGSRRVRGGGSSSWPLHRKLTSDAATWLAARLLQVPLADPLSGYFAVDAAFYRRIRRRLDPRGYKVLLEIAVRGQPECVREFPFTFRTRKAGHSKLSLTVMLQLVQMLLALRRFQKRR